MTGGSAGAYRAGTASPSPPPFLRTSESGDPSRCVADFLIDWEEDRTLRAVLVGMLREMDVSGR